MKKLFGKFLLHFAWVNLVAFLLFYISAYILMNDAIEYIRYFIGEAIDFALPVVTAALLAMAMVNHGLRALWLGCAAAIGRLVYLCPSMYLEFVGAGNLNSIDAIILSFPFAIGIAVIELLFSVLIVFLIQLICGKMAAKHGKTFEVSVGLARAPFDFSNEFSVSVLIVSAIPFIINLATEIVDAITFLSEYGDSYQIGEIIYIAISFIMILANMLITQVVVFGLKKKIDRSTD